VSKVYLHLEENYIFQQELKVLYKYVIRDIICRLKLSIKLR